MCVYVARVESHSNVADAPSRLDFQLMRKLGAMEVAPVLPACAFQLWDETVMLGRTMGTDSHLLPPGVSAPGSAEARG